MMSRRVASGGATWALVPVKSLTQAKSRLAPTLSAEQRIALQRAMLGDVLAALSRSRSLDAIAVVTGDDRVAEFAREFRAVALTEPAPSAGLNAAVTEGVARLRQLGATRALVVPADIPLLDAAEVDEVVDLGTRARLTLVAPSHDLGGTNGLLVHLDEPPDFAFGQDSFRRHMRSSRGRPTMRMSLPSFAFDVDTSADLAALAARLRASTRPATAQRTAAWAAAHLPHIEEYRG